MIAKLIRIGANGYLLKNAEKNELLEAIYTVSEGNQYFSKEVKEIYNEFSLKLNQNSITTTQLSSREEEVIKLISQGLTTQEIGDKLFISLNTVNTHRRNLLSKLNAKNTAGLVKYAVENGFLD
jgi:DNA-binding NarL/FixJ family response regulator